MKRVPLIYYLLLFIALVVANIQVYQGIFARPLLEVHVLQAGKGNAIFIKSPAGKTVLVNAGSDASILREIGTLLPGWQRELDAVVLTDTALGSMGGLPDVLKRYRTTLLIRPEAEGSWSREAALAEAIKKQPALKIVPAAPSMHLSLGSGATLDLDLPEVRINYGATSLNLSDLATTSARYISDGKTFTRIK